MHEILRSLPPGSLVLDLSPAEGSFPQAVTSATVERLDQVSPNHRAGRTHFVQGDAALLPFLDHTFAAVISNHSLEHFDNLVTVLREIRRVISSNGCLFVAVPDASTVTDKLYRWLSRGGGHVNAFVSADKTAALIERATGLRHVATRALYSSLSFLNRRNAPRPLPRRLLLLGSGYEWSLFLYVWLSRRLDRLLNTRTSMYGWGFYFGNVVEAIDIKTWVNVCIRCGAGSPSRSLIRQGLVRSSFVGFWTYRCPHCGAINPFADD